MGDFVIRFAFNVAVFFWVFQTIETLWHIVLAVTLEKLDNVRLRSDR
jgi:hypothetical protein